MNGERDLADADDSRLVRMAADQASTVAFEELMSRYHERTYAVIFRLVRDSELAADLTQETFMKAWRGIGGFAGDSSFFTWLYRIARNQVSSEFRRQRARPHIAMSLEDRGSDGEGPKIDPADPEVGPEGASERDERRQRIIDAIHNLAPDFKEIIVLRDLEKKSYEEMAEMLEVPVGTIRSRLHRARTELKERLKDYLS